jgi:hypothetical protein
MVTAVKTSNVAQKDYSLCSSSGVIKAMKWGRLSSWTCNTHEEDKSPVQNTNACTWRLDLDTDEGNIKFYLQEARREVMNWVYVAQESEFPRNECNMEIWAIWCEVFHEWLSEYQRLKKVYALWSYKFSAYSYLEEDKVILSVIDDSV